MLKRLASLTLMAVALLVGGCAQRVPSTTDDFSAAKKMVVTLRDGETISGRFAPGEEARYVTFGKIYRGRFEDVRPPNIILQDVYVEEAYDKRDVQRQRLEGSSLKVIDEDAARLMIPYYKIVQVQEIGMNRPKTTRGFMFWTFTSIIVGTIISTRF